MALLQKIETLKKTPLYDRHAALGGKIVNFGGFALPIQYTSILAEHQWTRQNASAFDVSHLGEIRVKGPGAFEFLQKCVTNDLSKIKDSQILYSVLCNVAGLALDDILIYQASRSDFYVIVNASNIDKDYAEFLKYAPSEGVSIENQSDRTACIAVQGPRSEDALQKLFGFKLSSLPYYSFKEEKFKGEPVWVSRSGYTGEDGFEIFSSNALCPEIWDRLILEGKKEGILPAGLGARNTLRLEAGNALYGNDLDETTTPLEAGLHWAVSFTKGDFVGRAALLKQKEEGLKRKLVAFKMLDKPIAREHYAIFAQGRKIGHVTSGSYGPTAGGNIGLGYVETAFGALGAGLEIEIHGRPVKAEVVLRPFIPLKHRKGLKNG